MLLREELPTYKIAAKGLFSLSDLDCLALIIAGDEEKASLKARAILSVVGSLTTVSKMTLADLTAFVAPREAKRIMAAFELARRKSVEPLDERQKISSSRDAFNCISANLTHLAHEEFWIIVLNKANEVIAIDCMSKGGTAGTVVDLKIIMKRLIERKAAAFIAVHNHPSGNLQPSNADISVTKNMKEAGKVLDLPLLDHLIVSDRGYYSFADESGLL